MHVYLCPPPYTQTSILDSVWEVIYFKDCSHSKVMKLFLVGWVLRHVNPLGYFMPKMFLLQTHTIYKLIFFFMNTIFFYKLNFFMNSCFGLFNP